MKLNSFVLLVCSLVFVTTQSLMAEESKKSVKYKSQGRIDFESLLIEGERKKPEMAVVTGNIGEKDSGLLKFRTNFLDTMAQDFGESVE